MLVSGTWNVMCSVSYLRHLAASPSKVEALLQLAKKAWDGTPGGAAYGYGNLAITLARPVFDPRNPRPSTAPMPWGYIKPPAERAHAVPIAYTGNDIEGTPRFNPPSFPEKRRPNSWAACSGTSTGSAR
jgi:hypothetical protein